MTAGIAIVRALAEIERAAPWPMTRCAPEAARVLRMRQLRRWRERYLQLTAAGMTLHAAQDLAEREVFGTTNAWGAIDSESPMRDDSLVTGDSGEGQ